MDISCILSELSMSGNRLDVQLASGTKIVTLDSFDVINMVENDVGVAPIDSVNSIGDDVNVGNSKDVNLDNEDNDSDNDVEENDNQTTNFIWHQKILRIRAL
ncbi:hypothetical protein Tco_0284892 [Tanacetum coccineum]